MAWTSPKTWSTGEVLTSFDMNVYVRDNTNFLKTATQRGYRYLADTLRTASTSSADWTVVHPDFSPTVNMTGGRMKIGFVGWADGDNFSDLRVHVTINGIQGGKYILVRSDAGQDLELSPVWIDNTTRTGSCLVALEFSTTVSGFPAGMSVQQFWIEEMLN